MGAPVKFKSDLNLTSAITIIVGSMIGSGILILPAKMLVDLPNPWLVLLVFLVAALLTVTGALTFAEMSSMFPKAGGQYHFLKEGLGPHWSYMFGWSMFWVIQTGIIAAVAVAFAIFADFFVEFASGGAYGLPGTKTDLGFITLPPWGQAYTAIACIVFLGFVNYFGVKYGGIVQNVTTFAKAIGLLGLVAMVLLIAEPVEGTLEAAKAGEGSGLGLLAGFGIALAASMFAYDGWPQATYVASEVKNPKRNVPLALLLGPLITAAIYMLVTYAYFAVIPTSEAIAVGQDPNGRIATEAGRAALDGMNVSIGSATANLGELLIAAVGLISVFGTVNGYILTSPRVFYSLAEDGALVPGMAKMNDKGVPGYAMLLTVIWSSLLVMTGLYLELAIMVVFGIWLFYIPTAIAHMRMRKTMGDVERPYRTPWYPVIPIIFLAAAVFIVVVIFIGFLAQAIIASVLIALGVPAYYLQKRAAERKAEQA